MLIVVDAEQNVRINHDGTFGRIEGKIDGSRLTGRFFEDNGAWGKIVLVLGPENRTFAGQWRGLNLEDDYWHDCKDNR